MESGCRGRQRSLSRMPKPTDGSKRSSCEAAPDGSRRGVLGMGEPPPKARRADTESPGERERATLSRLPRALYLSADGPFSAAGADDPCARQPVSEPSPLASDEHAEAGES